MTTKNDLDVALGGIRAQHASGLSSHTAAERQQALVAARTEVEAAAERDRARRDREAQHAAEQVKATLDALEARADEQRRACATSICKSAFTGDSSLSELIRVWRVEPTRVATAAIVTAWRALDERCQVELGAELGLHVMCAAFVDSIVAETPAALAYLAMVDVGIGVDSGTIEALGQWRKAQGVAEAERALAEIERALLVVARRPQVEITSAHRELHALRKSTATRSDWSTAQAELGERQRAEATARFAREYKAPPLSPPPLLGGVSMRVPEWDGRP